uniref:Uncharacterized protein n=1 Tax=Setaria viridis TaxID=4556 RepID=A0A4U6TNE0_SETVI|nr:hypothetical protein SEVIR_7G097350v2 [Setaria viridis]
MSITTHTHANIVDSSTTLSFSNFLTLSLSATTWSSFSSVKKNLLQLCSLNKNLVDLCPCL